MQFSPRLHRFFASEDAAQDDKFSFNLPAARRSGDAAEPLDSASTQEDRSPASPQLQTLESSRVGGRGSAISSGFVVRLLMLLLFPASLLFSALLLFSLSLNLSSLVRISIFLLSKLCHKSSSGRRAVISSVLLVRPLAFLLFSTSLFFSSLFFPLSLDFLNFFRVSRFLVLGLGHDYLLRFSFDWSAERYSLLSTSSSCRTPSTLVCKQECRCPGVQPIPDLESALTIQSRGAL